MNTIQLNNIKAVGVSIGIHLLLLLLLLFWKFESQPKPTIEEQYLEVNLGSSDDGWGIEQPEDMRGPAPLDPSSTAATSTVDNVNFDAATEAVSDPVAVAPSTPRSRATVSRQQTRSSNTQPNNRTNTTRSTQPPVRNARYTYAGGQGEGGNSASRTTNSSGGQGDGTGSGDKGVPGGRVGGAYMSAVPNLKGRSLRTKPSPTAKFNQGGIVRVRVVVDQKGNVITYSIVSAANATIRAIVKRKMKAVSFTKSMSAPPEQSGEIVFKFSSVK